MYFTGLRLVTFFSRNDYLLFRCFNATDEAGAGLQSFSPCAQISLGRRQTDLIGYGE